MRVKMLIGGAIGDTAHSAGDEVDAPDNQAKRWIKAGIAEEVGGGGFIAEPEPPAPEPEPEPSPPPEDSEVSPDEED